MGNRSTLPAVTTTKSSAEQPDPRLQRRSVGFLASSPGFSLGARTCGVSYERVRDEPVHPNKMPAGCGAKVRQRKRGNFETSKFSIKNVLVSSQHFFRTLLMTVLTKFCSPARRSMRKSSKLLANGRSACPQCHMRMITACVEDGPEGFEHRTFECHRCGLGEQGVTVSDPVNPKAVGWLNSELRPPK
jgi:hypothetical protein